MDGGTIWNTNLVTAVERCKWEVGADEKDITIDIIICGHKEVKGMKGDKNAYSNYLGFKSINDYYSGIADINEFRQAYPHVNFRYFVQPDHDAGGGPLSMLDFKNSSTWAQQEMGRSDGHRALKMGEGYMF